MAQAALVRLRKKLRKYSRFSQLIWKYGILPAFGLIIWIAPQQAHAYGTISESVSIPFPKWQQVLTRSYQQDYSCLTNLETKAKCQQNSWYQFLSELVQMRNTLTPWQAMQYINSIVNSEVTYQDDSLTWGKSDYWSTPQELFAKKRGDCEDFAIAKYTLLRAIGFSDKDLGILMLQDRQKNIAHAAIAVHLGDKEWLLDSNSSDIVPIETASRYIPLYRFNSRGWTKLETLM